MANITNLKGNWKDQKSNLKRRFATLTGNRLLFDEDKNEAMIGLLQIKLGKTKEQMKAIISKL